MIIYVNEVGTRPRVLPYGGAGVVARYYARTGSGTLPVSCSECGGDTVWVEVGLTSGVPMGSWCDKCTIEDD